MSEALTKLPILGEHRLAIQTIERPPEWKFIAPLQQSRYSGFEAVEEARNLNLLRFKIRHAELSPTFKCPEDCGGCPDRASLHINDPFEPQIDIDRWFEITEKLTDLGVEYFMLIGGTIDRDKRTPQLMKHILSLGESADFGWFTDGIMLQNWKDAQPTLLYKRLVEEGRMLEGTTHVSADYLVQEGISLSGPILDPKIRWENEFGGSRFYKSAYGERLARKLVEYHAKRVVLNTAISAYNIDQVIPIYNYAVSLQDYAKKIGSLTVVLYTFSPWIWRPHLARGDDPRNYDTSTLLNQIHTVQLKEISEHILKDTQRRLVEGLPRVAGNSSGYIAGLPDFAIYQHMPYYHGSSELSVQPDGTVRMDPLFANVEMLKFAQNPYGYRDRDTDFNIFKAIFDQRIIGPKFPNLVQTTKGIVAWN